MNSVVLMGRFTADPDIRYTSGEHSLCIAGFTLAVDRRFKREGEQSADFIRCAAFGKVAEHIEKYYHKGMKTCLSGRIQTKSYENRDGQRVYVTEVVVENMEFAESKGAQGTQQPAGRDSYSTQPQAYGNTGRNKQRQAQRYTQDDLDGFMNIPDGFDSELPFT